MSVPAIIRQKVKNSIKKQQQKNIILMCNLTICTININENRQDLLYHAAPMSNNFTEMHCKLTVQISGTDIT